MHKVIIRGRYIKTYPFTTEKEALEFINKHKDMLGEYTKENTSKGYIWLGDVTIEYEGEKECNTK